VTRESSVMAFMFKITDITPQKNDPHRLNIYLDGEFGFGVARIIAPWLKVGESISASEITELKKKDEAERAYQRAIHFLSYRDRSADEIRSNLSKHDISEEAIDKVLDRLRHKDLIDDLRFALKWVDNRREFHPRSRRALFSELRRKGVSVGIIENALEEVDDRAMAYRVAQKKIRRLSHLEWEDFRKKLTGYLARRGFSYGVTADIVREVWDELQEQEPDLLSHSESF
jgi:regulatory protein